MKLYRPTEQKKIHRTLKICYYVVDDLKRKTTQTQMNNFVTYNTRNAISN